MIILTFDTFWHVVSYNLTVFTTRTEQGVPAVFNKCLMSYGY